jgi:CheY-like chemotaxis protein
MRHSPGPADRPVEATSFAGRRVLVVEDEFLVSLATTDLLESLGCVIVGPAPGLSAALQLAQSEALDAAILDVDLAGKKVWPVAERLQRRSVPFLFLSAHDRLAGAPPIFAAGPHLQKPLEPNRLIGELATMWGI